MSSNDGDILGFFVWGAIILVLILIFKFFFGNYYFLVILWNQQNYLFFYLFLGGGILGLIGFITGAVVCDHLEGKKSEINISDIKYKIPFIGLLGVIPLYIFSVNGEYLSNYNNDDRIAVNIAYIGDWVILIIVVIMAFYSHSKIKNHNFIVRMERNKKNRERKIIEKQKQQKEYVKLGKVRSLSKDIDNIDNYIGRARSKNKQLKQKKKILEEKVSKISSFDDDFLTGFYTLKNLIKNLKNSTTVENILGAKNKENEINEELKKRRKKEYKKEVEYRFHIREEIEKLKIISNDLDSKINNISAFNQSRIDSIQKLQNMTKNIDIYAEDFIDIHFEILGFVKEEVAVFEAERCMR